MRIPRLPWVQPLNLVSKVSVAQHPSSTLTATKTCAIMPNWRMAKPATWLISSQVNAAFESQMGGAEARTFRQMLKVEVDATRI